MLKNYTEQLKKHWKSNDLTFIATLHKINNNHGFLNHFINPTNKMRLFYPAFDDTVVEDKKVSFFYPDSKNLNHGDYYKVILEFKENTNVKNNPYSLIVSSVSSLDQLKVKQLLEESNKNNEQDNVSYYGCYRKISDILCVFENVMNSESGEILIRDGESQQIFVSPRTNLVEKAYYSFTIKENSEKRPNAIQNSIVKLDSNPYKEYIRLRFERLNNPEANKMIANLMREIGKGMYSSKQRMIFELLQNADDAPGKEKVEFHIDINGDYFFVMHDGAPFNKDDVEAITSAAESTKRGNNKKTGYKGIGFKSVFTDSIEVWLKSGGYQFAFIRNSELFEEFDKFYFSSERYKKYSDLLEEDKLKYRNQRLRFNGSTDIPWQVIPIWQDNLPSEFNDSNFNNFNNPVQFALKLGKSNIDEYKNAIDNIAKRPQFLLFLRNTSKFRSPKNGVTVSRNDSEDVIKITKTKIIRTYELNDERKDLKNGTKINYKDSFYKIIKLVDENKVIIEQDYSYTKIRHEKIEVSDEAFISIGIGLKKASRINDYNEVSYFFTDLENREIETIPPKLASVNETEISFGISLIDEKISPEKEYSLGISKYSSLFTYLPMEDTRFQLPFLVNADFVPSSDRQKIQGDNLWNKYIMIKVAEKHVETLSRLADAFIKNETKCSSYLSLLLKRLLPADDTAQKIIDSYNEKYVQQVKTVEFIVNDLYQKQLISNTIIDDSGLIEIFGHELFYEIINTDKRLPHANLEIKYLKKYDYLNIEVIDIEKLAKNITPTICERIGELIANKTLYESEMLMLWLDKLVVYLPKNFGKIPFIVHNNSLFSLELLVSEEDAWILNKYTTPYKALFSSLGYHTVDLQLDKYAEVNSYLLSYDGYLNDKTQAYDRIESNKNLSKLKVKEKIELINFLKDSKFMYGIGEKKYYGELKVFVDENKTPKPLRHLISRIDLIESRSINQFKIVEEEYNLLPDLLKNELIKKENIFTSFILNPQLFQAWNIQFNSESIEQYVRELSLFFSWKDAESEILQSQWASIPWLYIDDKQRFIESNKIYWSHAFSHLSADKYITIKSLLHDSTLKILPDKICGELVKTFDLKTDSTIVGIWNQVKPIDTISANILLDWLEEDGNYNDFFDNFTFNLCEDGKWQIIEIGNTKVFDGSDLPLKTYINSENALSKIFTELDKTLCTNKRYKIGLLQGDKLIDEIIDSKLFSQSIATLLPHDLKWDRVKEFIKNLTKFELTTNTEYNSNSPEHLILNLILKKIQDLEIIPPETQEVVDCLIEKITINKLPMSDFDLSDNIQFGKGEEKKELKLSDVLEEFKGESDVLDNIRESFTSISEKSKLRKIIFKTRSMTKEEICQSIEKESTTYYSVNQVLFQILYSMHNGNRKWTKMRFDQYLIMQDNKDLLLREYDKFFDIIYNLNLTILKDFNFLGFELNNCIENKYAIETENLPTWLQTWINRDSTKRYKFISQLGFNGIDSPIVKLRQAAISDDFDQNQVIRFFQEAKSNKTALFNTIKWLSKYSSIIITRNIPLIQLINKAPINVEKLPSLIIPVIISITSEGKRQYALKSIDVQSDIYMLNNDEFHSYSIFNSLTKENDEIVIIDSSIGDLFSNYKIIKISLEEVIDIENLENNSELWEEAFYKKWELHSKFPIYIFNGNEIPYNRQFNNKIINSFTKDLKVEVNQKFFVSKMLKMDLLSNLPNSFPELALTNLKDWHYRTLQNESLLDEDSYEYNENIDRLIQDRLGISKDQQQKESGNAKTHTVYFLDSEGFNVSQVINFGSYLSGIKDKEGNSIICIVRSAKGGLLYLDKHHWDMLDSKYTYLVVIYPGNAPRLFKNKIELLNEELAENILFRIPNTKKTDEMDSVFNVLKSEANIILVTSEKMKESLFSKLKTEINFQKESDTAVKGDDFKF